MRSLAIMAVLLLLAPGFSGAQSAESEAECAGRDALVIVYCASGTRSGVAARYLAEQGYTSVIDFGSINRLQGALDVGP